MPPFFRERNFASLSVKDLLEARDAYHVHLAHMENVVGTAIGRYRIREEDPDARNPYAAPVKRSPTPRTLHNTVVAQWSWPCVLVFVDRWLPPDEFARKPGEMVPPRLYLPDGRVVPTCVVLAARDPAAAPPLRNLHFPTGLIGGGYPALTDVQGEVHVGSLGCLVSDGDAVFALTNRHVVGEAGREVFTLLHGLRQRIGVTHEKMAAKIPFDQAYPGWPAYRALANLDVGLVRLDDLRMWTAQVFGVGEIGDLIDLNVDNVNLDLVGCPVRAFGAASGPLRGIVHGLFYRYKSVGGFDYIADFLIGPRPGEESVTTLPGDSGTIWFWDPPKDTAKDEDAKQTRARQDAVESGQAPPRAPQLRPLAIQWGGHAMIEPGGQARMQFALATTLATVCRHLDVEIVRNWDIGHSEYWGKVGHYKIAAKACDLVAQSKLKKLMAANADRIGVADNALISGNLPMNNQPEFVALADVPDLVWRSKRGKDKASHFADMDQEGKGAFAGKTLLDLWGEDPATLNTATWGQFYDSIGVTTDSHRGSLPFRVWQIYDAMVAAVRAADMARYVCAAGILAHYVGDACQPLHVSHLHHGRPGHPEEDEVHSVYETKMVDRHSPELIAGVNAALAGKKAKADVTGGAGAAHSVIALMKNTCGILPPIEVIHAYNAKTGKARVTHMWEALGARTIRSMAPGALRLASLWESAWKEGGGAKIAANKLGAVNKNKLMTLYNDRKFLEAKWLDEMSFG